MPDIVECHIAHVPKMAKMGKRTTIYVINAA